MSILCLSKEVYLVHFRFIYDITAGEFFVFVSNIFPKSVDLRFIGLTLGR